MKENIKIYTYANPYELQSEFFWDEIKNCPHFCASQTLVNGLKKVCKDLENGPITTVDELINAFYKYWNKDLELKVEQFAIVEDVIDSLGLENKKKSSLKFNLKYIVDSIRLLSELNVNTCNVDGRVSPEQKLLFEIISNIPKNKLKKFEVPKKINCSKDIDDALKDALKDMFKGLEDESVSYSKDKIVFHGIHQFSPLMLKLIDEISDYKEVIIIFNYQKKFESIYGTWNNIYSKFNVEIKSSSKEYASVASSLFANSEKFGNKLAKRLGEIYHGDNESNVNLGNISVLEFDNKTEFANYVSEIYDNAIKERNKDILNNPNRVHDVLYYMKEQFYSANDSVNDILKIYYPKQFGKRHFLSYPIGQFFLLISSIWKEKEKKTNISNIEDLLDCINSGMLLNGSEDAKRMINTIKMISGYIELNNTSGKSIDDIIEEINILRDNINDINENGDPFLLKNISCFNVDIEDLELLIRGLKDLNNIINHFFTITRDTKYKLDDFYKKVQTFLKSKLKDYDELDNQFKEMITNINNSMKSNGITGSYQLLKDSMMIYLNDNKNQEDHANWIVRNFEQIDGDIIRTEGAVKSVSENTYHYCCLSDNDMNVSGNVMLPWPLNINFFKKVCSKFPSEWKANVYIRSLEEYKNFKKYALFFGLYFCKSKIILSYIKNYDETENDLYYLFKLAGINVIKYFNTNKVITKQPPNKYFIDTVVNNEQVLNQACYLKPLACKYKFFLENIVNSHVQYRDTYKIKTYIENAVYNKVYKDKGYAIKKYDKQLENYAEDKVEECCKYVHNITLSDKMSIQKNVLSFLKKSIEERSKVSSRNYVVNKQNYIEKKNEFLIFDKKLSDTLFLSYNKADDGMSDYEKHVKKINLLLQSDESDLTIIEPTTDSWCENCSNKEVCLSYFLLNENNDE